MKQVFFFIVSGLTLISCNNAEKTPENIEVIKQDSSKWINQKKFTSEKFEWQSGFGAFSYSKSQASSVIAYVHNQENHHRKISFLDEYKKFLEKFEVAYDERYIFKAPE